MTYEQYTSTRTELLNAMQSAADIGDTTAFENAKNEISKLDTQYQEITDKSKEIQSIANQAIANTEIPTIADTMINPISVKITGGTTMDTMNTITNTAEQQFFNMITTGQVATGENATLLPKQYINRIYEAAKKRCPLLALSQPEVGDRNTVVYRSTDMIDPEYIAEGGAVTGYQSDDDSLAAVDLPVGELVKTIRLSTTAYDTMDDFYSVLCEQLTKVISVAADKKIATTLVAGADTSNTITCADTAGKIFDADTITTALSMLADTNEDTVIIANSATIWGDIAKLKDNDGRLILQTGTGIDGVVGMYNGIRVICDSQIPVHTVVVGNVENACAVVRGSSVEIEAERHAALRYVDLTAVQSFAAKAIHKKSYAVIKNTDKQTVKGS